MSHVIKELAGVLDIILKHATTKHAQTIGLHERSHASIKQALKIETGERRSLWHKYINIAVLNYNTSYHTNIGCESSRVFDGKFPYNVLDIKLGIRPQQQLILTSQIDQEVLEQTELIHQDVRKNIMQAYIKYKAFHDKKVNASEVKEAGYVYILQPKADHQGTKFPFTEFWWICPYIIEKVLPNNNYFVRKISTNKTHVLHRMRMRQFTPRHPPADITVKPQDYKSDPEVEHRSGSSLSLTTPWLLAGLLAVQSGTKTQILNNTLLLRCWRGTCNFEASFHRAPTNCPLFWLPRGNT